MENLAAKYRPKTLNDVVEQGAVITAVKNICKLDEITNRNFLFVGPAGTGKTTTARAIARELNGGISDNVIELDAASHGGVNDIRELIEHMRSYPVGSKYKVFILDECFPGDSLVHTTSGLVPIKDVVPGTRVHNLTGEATVSHVFENSVKVENLVCVCINHKKLITTRNHFFFTDEGWVEASNLKEGDVLYDYKTVQGMRERASSAILQRSQDLLQQRMQKDRPATNQSDDEGSTSREYIESVSRMYEQILDSRISRCSSLQRTMWEHIQREISSFGQVERATIKNLAFVYMSQLREEDGDSSERSKDSLWSELCKSDIGRSKTSSNFEKYCDEILRKLRKYVSSTLDKSLSEDLQSILQNSINSLEMFDTATRDLSSHVRKNEEEQSWSRSDNSRTHDRDKEEKWDIDSEACYAMWERTFFQASDSFEERIRGRVGVRISCKDECNKSRQSASLSIQLQTRPCLTKIATGDRGGWERPQYEISAVARRKEGEMFGAIRVDSIESYKRGSNDELFQSYFPNTALCDAEYVTMYDLEIDGHPSFFIDDILVHNCHSLSNSAWQSLLKVIEEQPARTINMFCTTNPEKIPQTIISRVQSFQLSKISLESIFNRLKYIIEQENKEGRNITYDDDAVLLISKLAQGGMRDSITNLDQCLSYNNQISVENVMKALNLPSYDDYFELLNAIAKKDNESIVNIVNRVYNSGANFTNWFDGFFSFVTNIVKFIYLQDINQTMIPSIYQDKIKGYGVAHSALCLKLSNKLVQMNKELKTTQYLQELAISYLCTAPVVKKG